MDTSPEAPRLIVPIRIEFEIAQQGSLAVDDPHLPPRDQQHDAGAGEGPAHADVMELALVADSHRAVAVDLVVADPELSREAVLPLYGSSFVA